MFFGPRESFPERPGCHQDLAPLNTINLSGAPIADKTASASAFASKASTGRRTPKASRGPVWPTSIPEANSSCSSGSPP